MSSNLCRTLDGVWHIIVIGLILLRSSVQALRSRAGSFPTQPITQPTTTCKQAASRGSGCLSIKHCICVQGRRRTRIARCQEGVPPSSRSPKPCEPAPSDPEGMPPTSPCQGRGGRPRSSASRSPSIMSSGASYTQYSSLLKSHLVERLYTSRLLFSRSPSIMLSGASYVQYIRACEISSLEWLYTSLLDFPL